MTRPNLQQYDWYRQTDRAGYVDPVECNGDEYQNHLDRMQVISIPSSVTNDEDEGSARVKIDSPDVKPNAYFISRSSTYSNSRINRKENKCSNLDSRSIMHTHVGAHVASNAAAMLHQPMSLPSMRQPHPWCGHRGRTVHEMGPIPDRDKPSFCAWCRRHNPEIPPASIFVIRSRERFCF